ncbi:hypothetical protein BLNAU_12850 [Blattamonas nauphoetae]|uniref:Uncharacterized protein n=1 Tax=Blattamonas nauphoetae TaxID=2049346 RepID=A0ABQ9XI85_9EUKA|nr:hypothetical protein BLNAU_12850 [Blattamonas nauphoetae]
MILTIVCALIPYISGEYVNIFAKCTSVLKSFDDRIDGKNQTITTYEGIVNFFTVDCYTFPDFVYKGTKNPKNRQELCKFIWEDLEKKIPKTFKDMKIVQEKAWTGCNALKNEPRTLDHVFGAVFGIATVAVLVVIVGTFVVRAIMKARRNKRHNM